MSDADWSTTWVRRAHADAVRLLRESSCLATPHPTLADLRVALARLGTPMPRERALRLALAANLPLADAPAERHYGPRPRRSY